MKRSKEERGYTHVNVEVTLETAEWMDGVCAERETTRSGLIRLAIRAMRERLEAEKGQAGKGGAK